ncbi:hypothetical protein MtrunA17_Chr4g0072881 [Medicago truncatula]|nr:hypothetical protein MtrunA17_Chr4g0072881 [Medicago truncatula]
MQMFVDRQVTIVSHSIISIKTTKLSKYDLIEENRNTDMDSIAALVLFMRRNTETRKRCRLFCITRCLNQMGYNVGPSPYSLHVSNHLMVGSGCCRVALLSRGCVVPFQTQLCPIHYQSITPTLEGAHQS